MRNGVPIFLQDGDAAEGAYKGLAEATFATPDAYSLVVKLKRAAFKDAALGIVEYVRDKVVLDVGCGPSLNLPHMENSHDTAAAYAGIDASMMFALSAGAENPGAKYRFAQASVTDLPFADKTFDTTIVSFTIHHVDDPEGRIMRELIRVTRSHIIIYDHWRSDNPVAASVQDAYWRVFDGGCNYMRWSQWERFLSGAPVVRKIRTGAIFGHVVKMVCTVP